MMWDIGGHGVSNTDRSRSRSPQPPHMRMPSPNPAYNFIPHSYHDTQAKTDANFIRSPVDYSMNSYFSHPTVAMSTSYNNYIPSSYPPIPRASPAFFPPAPVVPVVHHSKHHSSSKDKHNDHHKHSGHGHSHSHSHSHSHPQPRRLPSPSPMTFPKSQSEPFYMPSPNIQFPTVPHRPPNQSTSSNALLKAPSPRYMQSQPALRQSAKQTPRPRTKSKPPKLSPLPSKPLNPDFEYSKCTGRRRALCIGINYRGQENELRGCVNDARNVYKFLTRNNYNEIAILTDDTNDPKRLPTYDNIVNAMHWLVHDAQPHDSLFFHYSGHGGQTPDLDGDEADGMDEVIYPLDFKKRGHILDDLMHDIMVKPLPRGCRLTGLFDACHSGSVLDLPYVYSAHGRLKGSPITYGAQARKATSADVISWSACKDDETSADTFADGKAVGAMSHAFTFALKNKPHQTYQELFQSIRLILHPRYSQKPQLASSHHIDTNLPFIF